MTPRQLQVLDAIRWLTADRGFPPTLREVADRIGTIPNNVHQIVVRMRRDKLVEWDAHKSRTLRVVS